MTDKQQRVLTSGEVAKYCSVHLRTVIRWIQQGDLKAYKLPGRGNNRIEEKDFLAFLTSNGMPIPDDFQVSKPRILIVDDEKDMAKSIQRVLRKEDYDIYMAHDGFEAGAQLGILKPQLMTLDLSMPKMNGFSVLKFVRNQSEFDNLKIVVISALDNNQLKKAEKAGANASLSKPFDNQTLINTVKQLLEPVNTN
ncbi:response regulator [Agarilytica rhodophyticola]|uniref:response regulator n=1 Tax=Agarilytica rhodophyticola TaxID=1737490 RepID=UPI000B346C3E|nr:response regulator [Agarilytica rhodophyticola]